MASQKSAPVAITLISYITQSASTQGLLSAPCIVGQLVQIFMGAAFAPIVKRQIVKIKARRAASESEKALPAAESGDESNGEGKKGDRVQIIVDKGDGDVMLTTLQPKDCAGKLAVVVAHEAGMDNGESTQATAEPKAA